MEVLSLWEAGGEGIFGLRAFLVITVVEHGRAEEVLSIVPGLKYGLH